MGKKKTDSDMDMEGSPIVMEVSMKASGSMELWMDMESSITPVVILPMKVNGARMRLMVMEKFSTKILGFQLFLSIIQTSTMKILRMAGSNMRENSKMISSMVREFSIW